MITIIVLLLLATIIAILAIILAGIAYVAWPVLLVLGIGAFIDVSVLMHLFKRS